MGRLVHRRRTGRLRRGLRDGGATFGPRQPVAVLGDGLDNARRPEIGVLPDGRIAVLYQAFRKGGVRRVEARLRSPSGHWSAPVIVEPAAGVPRLAVDGDRGVVAVARGGGEAAEILVRDWRRAFPGRRLTPGRAGLLLLTAGSPPGGPRERSPARSFRVGVAGGFGLVEHRFDPETPRASRHVPLDLVAHPVADHRRPDGARTEILPSAKSASLG